MKTPSNELFLLIKSMSPKEKTYFKAFSTNNKKNDNDYFYVTLFDILNEMKQYDDSLLQSKVKNLGLNNNLSKTKNYLTKAILKSLTEYHSDTFVDEKIRDLIFCAEILYKKKMERMANKLLLKAEKLSLEYEKYNYLLLILSLKSEIMLEISDIKGLKEFMITDTKKEQVYFNNILNTLNYRNLLIEITIIDQTPEVSSANEIKNKKLKNLFDNPLMKNSESALTFFSKNHFYNLQYKYFLNQNKWNENSYEQLEEWVKYLEKKRETLKDFPEIYLRALGRLLGAANFLRKERETDLILKKATTFYESLNSKSINKNVKKVFSSFIINYMGGQLYFMKPENSVEIFMKMSNQTFKNFQPNDLNIVGYMNLSLSYFLLENYREALSYVNKVVNIKSDFRKDVQAFAKMFLLIVNFEMRNFELLPYISKSSERWLKINKYRLKIFDKILVDFFNHKVAKIITDEDEIIAFSDLSAQLKKNSSTDYSILQKEFDIVSWLRSKIEKSTYMDMLKNKVSKKDI